MEMLSSETHFVACTHLNLDVGFLGLIKYFHVP